MEENLGMVMVFTVVSAAMEWLGSKWEAVKEAREEREKEKKERIEAEERVSYFVDDLFSYSTYNFAQISRLMVVYANTVT